MDLGRCSRQGEPIDIYHGWSFDDFDVTAALLSVVSGRLFSHSDTPAELDTTLVVVRLSFFFLSLFSRLLISWADGRGCLEDSRRA
jgi:hypothetical protein